MSSCYEQKTDEWVKNIDKLLSGEITEQKIKSDLSAIGGKAVQKLYGKDIKNNLNTGTPWNAGTKGQNIGNGTPCTQAVKNKISAKNSGTGNGMYGTSYTDEEKAEKSAAMKVKILSGEFTPNTNNRNTHWEATYKGKQYRSSWEALYQHFNEEAEYETLRVKYYLDDVEHIYIVDFVDHINKIVVEVKPKELCVGEKFKAKKTALKSWADINEYSVLFVDRQWLVEQKKDLDYTNFDDNTVRKIKALYEVS